MVTSKTKTKTNTTKTKKATPKSQKDTTPQNQKRKKKSKYLRIGRFKLKKKPTIIILCLVVFIPLFIAFRKSDFWPWPSQSEIDQRMNDILDVCMYNENSRACRNTVNKYNLDFKYCYALSDIPEIDTLMPIYGVVQQKNFYTEPLSYMKRHATNDLSASSSSLSYVQAPTNDEHIVYPYYGCTSSIDEIRIQKGPSLISSPASIALFGLSKIPVYYGEGDYYGCSASWHGTFNHLWLQIPNGPKVKTEGLNLVSIYNKCSMLSDLNLAAYNINERLRAYANNYSVQQFYQKYDEWNQVFSGGCTWYDVSFNQRCGAGSENNPDSAGYGSMLQDFTNEMRQFLHTKYFTSRIVVTK